jgi:8-oxo-dGTP pyrophosphatase MutT (NUDIX family)
MFAGSSSVQQAAALPFRLSDAGYELLFVSTKRRGRWLLPKGWPKKGEALTTAAAREAREEAGVNGVISPESIGSYRYRKNMLQGYEVPCDVVVFPFRVDSEESAWCEGDTRARRWCKLADAPDFCDEPGLSRLLEQLDPDSQAAFVPLLSRGSDKIPAPPQTTE